MIQEDASRLQPRTSMQLEDECLRAEKIAVSKFREEKPTVWTKPNLWKENAGLK